MSRVDTGAGWGVVDESLVQRGGGWSPLRIGADVRFSGGGDRTVVSMATEGVVSRLVWDGPDPLLAPVIDGAVATYEDLLPGVDLMLRAGPVSVQYAWRFGAAAADLLASAGQIGLRIEADGAAPASDGLAGGVVLTPPGMQSTGPDAAGQLLAAGGWQDSAGGARGPAWPLVRDGKDEPSDMVGPATLALAGDELLLSWDAQPLGADAVFPLYARSSQIDIGKAAWTMVWSNGMSFWDDPVENARVGYDGFSSDTKVSRSFFQFDTTPLWDDVVDAGEFWHAQTHSPQHTCAQASWGPTVYFSHADHLQSSPPNWPGPALLGIQDSDSFAHGHSSYCPGDTRQAWNGTAMLQSAADGHTPLLSTALHSANEGDREGWRQYDNRTSGEGCTDQGGQWEGNCTAPRLKVVHRARPAPATELAVVDAYPDPEGVEPGIWLGVRHSTTAGFTMSARVDTDPPGQQQLLGADFNFMTSDGSAYIGAVATRGWQPGSIASGTIDSCHGGMAPCLGQDGSYQMTVFNIVDPGPSQIVAASAPLALRSDIQAPAQPVVAVQPAGAGVWRITLTNPDPTDYNLRRVGLGLSETGLYDQPLTDEEMRAYRDTGSVTVERPEAVPVVTWHAQSWDVARNPSPVGSATGRGESAGPSLVWPLDGNGTNLVPGGPPLKLAQTNWTDGC